MANLGELTTGLAVILGTPPESRSILRSLEVSYEKKARGLLTSTCSCEPVSPTENTEYIIKAEIRDEAADVVSVVSAVWVIGPKKQAS